MAHLQEAKNNGDNNNSNKSKLLNNEEEENEKLYAYGAQLVSSCALPMVLKATIDMGLLKIIYDHVGPIGLSSIELAAQIEAHDPEAPSRLDRMLRLLATYSVVECTVVCIENGDVERRYRAAPVTKFFVPDENGVSLGPNLNLLVDKVFLESWSKLQDAVMEGGVPFDMVYGMNAFEYSLQDKRFNEVFHKTMSQSTMIFKEMLVKYKGFENVGTLVDVGGSLGNALHAITSQYPSIKGINFDLPHVVKSAPAYTGVEHIGGDMFESVPNGDAIFMKWILHDWSDENCVKLLKNCYKALPDNGKMIIVESIMSEEPEKTEIGRAVSQLDILMLTQHTGGKERSLREFEALAKAAGFVGGLKLHCCARGCWVFEFYK